MADQDVRDDPVILDCTGLSLEAVFATALRRVRDGGAVSEGVVLEAVESAGPLISSDEQARIVEWVRYDGEDALGVPVTIRRAAEPQPVDVDADGGDAVLLAAAGALELRCSPVVVWTAVAQALTGVGPDGPVDRLSARQSVLVRDGDRVGFVDEHTHREVRRRFPLSLEQHRTVHGALLSLRGREVPGVADYLHSAWPVHAALAGELESCLEDPDFLVECGWYGVGLALTLAYPDGVPLGGVAGDLHCLLTQALAAPASHEEWLSWVHHSLVARGLADTADAVASRVRLPWRTVWSHWRWPGAAAPAAAGAAGVGGELYLVQGPEGLAVAGRCDDIDPDRPTEQVLDFTTGELLVGEGPVRHEVLPFDGGTSVGRRATHKGGTWQSANGPDGRVTGLPWTVDAVQHAVQCTPAGPGGTLWAYSGWCGMYAALVDEEAVAALPEVPHGRPFFQITVDARWSRPARVPLSGEVDRELIEQDWAFGPESCRALAPDAVPAGIVDGPARHVLTEIGWPVGRTIVGFRPYDLTEGGLSPVEDQPGLYAGLGTLGGRPLLLDGASGKVILGRRSPSCGPPVLVASSPARLLLLVLLQHTVLSVPMILDEGNAENLEEDAVAWVRELDAESAEAEFWPSRYSGLYEQWSDYPDTDFWIY
ncbi:SUKH-4 family immunity protein [Kitasatospora sp. NBC_00374]|uniref:SUKH-4 family immunity protein n=1 Tax=Kitasatospora sp. NBC_00374 TaxID=2975964 RepID=UPI0030E07FE4